MKRSALALVLCLLSAQLVLAACSQPSSSPAAPQAAAPTAAPQAAAPTAAPKIDFPTKPISLMVPTTAGATNDATARAIGAIAEKKLGQPINVLNKPGAGTQVGYTEMALAAPDGYYIGQFIQPNISAIILDAERKASFTFESFVPMIHLQLDPGIIWVKADSPYKSLADLIAEAKKTPGKVTAVTTGVLSDDHLAALFLERAADIRFQYVHMDGVAGEVTAILGGHVDVAFENVSAVSPKVQAGDARALAVMDKKRSRFLPDVPTTVELGFPTVLGAASRGMAAPKGVPQPILDKLTSVLKESAQDPVFIDQQLKIGIDVALMAGDEYRKYATDLHESTKSVVKFALEERGD